MDETLIRQLLEEILDSGLSPEEVCRNNPELLAEVRERLARLRLIESEVEAIFPTPSPIKSGRGHELLAALGGRLPRVPGHAIEALVGRGGMGVVYRARHLKLGRTVAIKMVLAGAFASAREMDCLLREAEAVAALQHPNIVQVYEVGELDGLPYFTMEYIEGGTLAGRLAGVPQGAATAATLVAELADAVQTAHDRGIVHRDLKPSNILLTAGGVPKIVDFSVARNIGSQETLTFGGARHGTPSYMAPEQATGSESAFSPSVDIYALGAVLYEMLTGRPPFRADTPSETQRQVITELPAPPSRLNMRVPKDLETICLKCLHKEPSRRYASASALALDLRRFLRGEPITARPVGRLERFIRWSSRNPAIVAMLVAVLAFVCVAAFAGAREWALVAERRAEVGRWADRLEHVLELQRAGRYAEAHAILGRSPEAGSTRLQQEVQKARADLDLVERLDAIRLGRGRFKDGGGLDYDEPARQYEVTLREIGLGEFEEKPEVVAARLKTSPVREAIVAALDDWAVCMLAEHRSWVLRVAQLLDPDPWRDGVRDSARWADVEHLSQLAADVKIEDQPVTILVAMATRWRRLGGDPTDFLLRVQRHYPDDFWVNFELGHLYFATSPDTAIGYIRAAIAARPHSGAAHFNLAINLFKLDRWADARYHFERTLESDPDHTWARRHLGLLLLREGKYAEAITNFEWVLGLHPYDEDARGALNRAFMLSGRAAELRARWEKELAQETLRLEAWDGYAELCLYLGDADAYGRACDELLMRFGASQEPRLLERIGRACLLAAGPELRIKEAARLIDMALAAGPEQSPAWTRPYFLFAKGLAEYRLGRFESAAEILKGEAATALGPAPGLVLAMTQHRLGERESARRSLEGAVASFDWSEMNAVSREAQIYHILRREAEDLMSSQNPS